MKTIRTILTLLLLTISTSLFAVDAELSNSSIQEENCRDVLINLLDKDKLNQILTDIKGADYLSKIIKVKEHYSECIKINFQKDIGMNVLYKIYGEPLQHGIAFSNALSSSVLELVNDFDSETLNIGGTNFSFLLIKLTEWLYWISTMLIAIVTASGIYKLIFIMGKKPNDKDVFLVLGKSFLGLALSTPMIVFGGYSLLQVLFLTVMVFATILAKILFTIISICFINVNQNYDIDAVYNSSRVYETIVGNSKPNISMHVCDMTMRERFMLGESFAIENSISQLKHNEFYQCLTDSSITYDQRSLDTFTPKQLLVGQNCAVKYGYLKEGAEYCGSLIFKEDKNKELAEKLGLTTVEYQNKLREIAIEMRTIHCRENATNYINGNERIYCMKQDVNGNLLADNTGRLISVNNGFTDGNDRNDYVSNVTEETRVYFKSFFENKIKAVFRDMIAITKQDNLKKDVDEALGFLQSGWFSSGMVFFINGNGTKDLDNEADAMNNSYRSTFEDFNYESVNEMEGSMYKSTEKLSINTIDGLFKSSEKDVERFRLIDIDVLINGGFNVNGNCQHDLSTCPVVSINPFYSIIHQGEQMMKDTTLINLTLNIAKMVINFTTKTPAFSAFLDIPIAALTAYFLIGFILSNIIPMVPFLFSVSSVLGWVLFGCITMLSLPFLAVYFILPDEKNEFVGREKMIYQLFLQMFLTPVFIVISTAIAFILTSFGIGLMNFTLSVMLTGLGLATDITTVMGIINALLSSGIYTIFTCMIVIVSSSTIYYLPTQMNKYLGIEIKKVEIFGKMRGLVEKNMSLSKLFPKM